MMRLDAIVARAEKPTSPRLIFAGPGGARVGRGILGRGATMGAN
jgi:hypothetical protein